MAVGAGELRHFMGWLHNRLAHSHIPGVGMIRRLLVKAEDRPFASFVSAHFDPAWYRLTYPDVAAAGIDPLFHWLDRGLEEGRRPGPNLAVRRGPDARQARGDAWRRFTWRGEPVAALQNDPCEYEALTSFLSAHFDPAWYRLTYPDVAAAGIDPLFHWLDRGLEEGRRPGPNLAVRRGPDARQARGDAWRRFTWRGEPIVLKPGRIAESVLSQIEAQARHDPAVLAAGADSLAMLPIVEAGDLLSRGGIDAPGVLASVAEIPSLVIMVPALTGPEPGYEIPDIVTLLVENGHGPIHVFVTEQTAQSAGEWTSQPALTPVRSAAVSFWPDLCGPAHANPAVIARLMNVLRPGRIIVAGSRLGLDMVARYGRGLSQFSRLYCLYPVSGAQGRGSGSGAQFARRTAPFALSLAGNEATARMLRGLYGDIPGPGIALLPPRLSRPAGATEFADRLAERIGRHHAKAPRRWAWVSQASGDEERPILNALARLRPGDTFDMFRLDGARPEPGFGDYQGLLFTCRFAEVPDAALEASQHAVPLIFTSADGQQETFDAAAALFVKVGRDADATAVALSQALDRVTALSPSELSVMLVAAREQVLARHSPEIHASRTLNLLGLP